MAKRVFVSYSRPDNTEANELVAHLEAHAIDCWIAPRDVEPGAEWAAEIVNAIASASVMVLIFSANANSSPHVRHEVELASNKRVRIVALRVADVQPTQALEYFLCNHHWLDAFPPPVEPHYARLVYCLNTILATPTNTVISATALPAQDLRPTFGSARPRFEPAKLTRLETELAAYIGPYARRAVRDAAAVASDVDSLLRRVGAEIGTETERRTFIAGCRGWLHS